MGVCNTCLESGKPLRIMGGRVFRCRRNFQAAESCKEPRPPVHGQPEIADSHNFFNEKFNSLKHSCGLTLCKPPQVNSYVDLSLLMELVCSWQVISQLKIHQQNHPLEKKWQTPRLKIRAPSKIPSFAALANERNNRNVHLNVIGSMSAE